VAVNAIQGAKSKSLNLIVVWIRGRAVSMPSVIAAGDERTTPDGLRCGQRLPPVLILLFMPEPALMRGALVSGWQGSMPSVPV
jgi:hypothetical protein